ncbi:hypothetical protein CIRG_02169 [Coccidioides immitis RMSCC 2394]|uniref:Uncharacterized protein n=1 Tax=Coccidioides immitis RMSCC 2394 TaxID=404692 RepID=A0A0J6Y2U5_COCIT|nr:hypothetical protein CIRG_02169 [Coccidioides immitis RMSCC 2394]
MVSRMKLCTLCNKVVAATNFSRHVTYRCQRHQTTSGASNQPLEHRNSAELVALLDEISSLQSDRKFPECELGNLELLVDGQELHWTRPALIPISEVWDKQFSPLDIFDAVRSSIKDLPPNCVYRDGEPITEAEQEWNISNAFYQAGIPLHNSDLSAKSSLMNVPLPGKFHRLQPCQALRNQLRIASDHNLNLLANFAPAGTFVDIHLNQNQHGLSQSGCLSSPGWLHATFTTKPGALVGINFKSLEGLEIMARSVAIHLPYIYQVPQAVLEDFSEYARAILFFLDNKHDPQIITTVLKSWIMFSKGLSGVQQHVGFQSAVLAFLDGLKKGLSQKEAWCCGTAYKNVLRHIAHAHGVAGM